MNQASPELTVFVVVGPGCYGSSDKSIPGANSERIMRGSAMELFCWFAFLHDCCRVSESRDDEHGPRAALLVEQLYALGHLFLSKELRSRLVFAIAEHSNARTTTDPLVGVCWDADRMDLPRVFVTPFSDFMSTDAGKKLFAPRPTPRRGVMR